MHKPEPKDDFDIVHCQDDLCWMYIPDYRGQIYYNTVTGEPITINELSKTPKNLTALKPLDKTCKWDGEKWILDKNKRNSLQQRQQIRNANAINTKHDDRCVNGGSYVSAIPKRGIRTKKPCDTSRNQS
ncbi:hypothetical protein [Avibacterium endocarditidis]|uniref:Tail fiber assembly protein n=1 Tax=Avibacterium endocarditidis TaxID=380674 RepID=A0ABX4ZSZ9_9PAST|nr:hypothetical protein [Avibacterium endocarditidis]POY42592.1 hypothetical protein C3Z13_04550 [Avibacterium endocarditidis]